LAEGLCDLGGDHFGWKPPWRGGEPCPFSHYALAFALQLRKSTENLSRGRLKPKLVWIIFKTSARIARKTQHFTVTRINRLTAVYIENRTGQKHKIQSYRPLTQVVHIVTAVLWRGRSVSLTPHKSHFESPCLGSPPDTGHDGPLSPQLHTGLLFVRVRKRSAAARVWAADGGSILQTQKQMAAVPLAWSPSEHDDRTNALLMTRVV
jgi:hypothetical protein